MVTTDDRECSVECVLIRIKAGVSISHVWTTELYTVDVHIGFVWPDLLEYRMQNSVQHFLSLASSFYTNNVTYLDGFNFSLLPAFPKRK